MILPGLGPNALSAVIILLKMLPGGRPRTLSAVIFLMSCPGWGLTCCLLSGNDVVRAINNKNNDVVLVVHDKAMMMLPSVGLSALCTVKKR